MSHTVNELMNMTEAELDALFSASPAGPIPNGRSTGTVIASPGSDVNAALAKLAGLVWQGKVFDAQDGTLLNIIGGHKVIAARVYDGPSLLDGRQAIILDYSADPGPVQHVRDEIRLIDPRFYLGKAYWDGRPLIYFCLQFASGIQGVQA